MLNQPAPRAEVGVLRVVKFSVVSAGGVAVQFALLAVLVHACGLHYLLSTCLAVEAAVLHNFIWHERWTWRDRPRIGLWACLRRLIHFHLANGLVSLLGNVLLMRCLVNDLGLPVLPANLISLAACALANFLAADRAVFRDRR